MAKRLSDQEHRLRSITERQYQKQITDLATLYGWKFYHANDSRAVNKHGKAFGDKDSAGFPDLLLARPGEVVVCEVKRETGKTTENQDEWLALFAACGIDTFVSRPSTFEEIRTRLTRARPV